jgi:hypothetical protein
MISDLEKDNVMRTKRARRCRRVLFHRSTWAVSPVSRAHRRVLLLGDDRGIHLQKVSEAVALTISLWNGFPQALACPFTPITHRIGDHLSRLTAEGDPNPRMVLYWLLSTSVRKKLHKSDRACLHSLHMDVQPG